MKLRIYLGSIALLIFSVVGCKKDFLEEKEDYTGVNEDVFKDSLLARAYVDFVYGLFLPGDNGIAFVQYQTGDNGSHSDAYTKTTDELAGQTDFNREWASISILQNHANKYFGQRIAQNVPNNVWTRMKQINLFLSEIDKHGLSEGYRNKLKGQMYFWRGFQYFELLKLYGGVPLVLLPQNPIIQEGDKSNEVQRSSSTETLTQIEADLDQAIHLLPGKWDLGSDWGRITSGAAAALKGRVFLTWASPLFNRSDSRDRWQKAYEANLAAKNLLEANGFGLYMAGGTADAKAWENMWFAEENNPEAVLVYNFNTVTADQTQRNNGWEQACRSKQILGNGSISPTKQMVDAFPMKDGKMPGVSSNYPYNPKQFYKNRDPRFYKTFVYNGALWPYGGNANYRQWTYSWFTDAAQTKVKSTETQGANASGIYLRKATNPNANNSVGNFGYSGTNYMEIRFAEVLLNLAEAAIGSDKLGEGLEYIKLIRQRAGIEEADNYGLGSISSRDGMFGTVLNERKIELMYENKRFWDLRRWLLFNDDFGTCTRLGFQPINGTRRTGYWIYVTLNASGTRYVDKDKDPMIAPLNGNAPLVEREPRQFPPGVPDQDAYLDSLYNHHFQIVERDNLDPTNPPNWKFTWYNQYYFFGLHETILSGTPYLQQTQNWPDLGGAMGTFDPLK